MKDSLFDSFEHKLCIVGGGMVGLSLALMLARALPQVGIIVLEADKQATEDSENYPLSFDARSTAVSQDSIEMLEAVGIWEKIAIHSTGIHAVHVSDRGHCGTAGYSEDDNGQQALGAVVENRWLNRQLADAAKAEPNIRLLAPARASAIRFAASHATIAVTQEDTEFDLPVDLAVIADGANSALRQQLGINIDEHDYHQHALVANVETENCHEGCAFERFTAKGPMALLPLGESRKAKRSALVWTTPEAEIDAMLQCSDQDFLAQLQNTFGYRLGQFTRVGERVSYQLRKVLAAEQVRSRVVLMGNAAHFLHPVAGQGFNLALRDCQHLVRCLAAAPLAELGSLPVLQQYETEQAADQWLTTTISHGFNGLFSDSRKALAVLRTVGLLGLTLVPPARTKFFNQMMGKGNLTPSKLPL